MKAELRGLEETFLVIEIDKSFGPGYIAVKVYRNQHRTEGTIRILEGKMLVYGEELKAAVDSIAKLCQRKEG